MGSSYIEFQENGFWVNDLAFKVWLSYLVRAIDLSNDHSKWLIDARNYWNDISKIGLIGSIDPHLDQIIDDKKKLDTILVFASTALNTLKKEVPTILKELLNTPGVGGKDAIFTQNVHIENCTKAGEAFIQLLEKKKKTFES